MIKKEYYLYIIRCLDGTLYIGITNNVESRMKRHKRGIAAKFTRIHPPGTIVYKEKFMTYKDARSRETQIKKWRRD